jgi:hypothetical protein
MKLISLLFSNLVMTAIAAVTTLNFVFVSPLEATERIRDELEETDQPKLLIGLRPSDPANQRLGGFYALVEKTTFAGNDGGSQKTIQRISRGGQVISRFPVNDDADALAVDGHRFYVSSLASGSKRINQYNLNGTLVSTIRFHDPIHAFTVGNGLLYVATKTMRGESASLFEIDSRGQTKRQINLPYYRLETSQAVAFPHHNSQITITEDGHVYFVSNAEVNVYVIKPNTFEAIKFEEVNRLIPRTLGFGKIEAVAANKNKLCLLRGARENFAYNTYEYANQILGNQVKVRDFNHHTCSGNFKVTNNNEIYLVWTEYLEHDSDHRETAQTPITQFINGLRMREITVKDEALDITTVDEPQSQDIELLEARLSGVAINTPKPFTDVTVK